MASILRRIFPSKSSRTPLTQAKPIQVDGPYGRTFLGNVFRTGIIIGSMYCSWNLFTTYFYDTAITGGWSMYPTIPNHQSSMIQSRRYAGGRNIQLGDVVEINSPIQQRGKVAKRVIGMPGDYVVRDANLAPTVGGASLHGNVEQGWKEPMMVQVPEGHVWLAGDNMVQSRDSRFYGPVPLAMITGKGLWTGDGYFSWTWLENTLKPHKWQDR